MFNPVIHTFKKNIELQKIFKSRDFISIFISQFSTNVKKLIQNEMDNVTELADLVEDKNIEDKSDVVSLMNIDIFSESESDILLKEQKKIKKLLKLKKKARFRDNLSINRNNDAGSKVDCSKKFSSEVKNLIKLLKNKKKSQNDSEQKLLYTHFISIPTNSDEIKKNFLKFKNAVLDSLDEEKSCLIQDMFQTPEKLHLTICMLHLLDEGSEHMAIEALNNCKKEIITPTLNENQSLTLEFKGLKFLGKSPAEAKVLYIDVIEESGTFQKMCDTINSYFIKKGLSRREYKNLTLHLTVINNVFHLRKNKPKKKKYFFDATNILKDHADAYLGKYKFSSFYLHLSKLTGKSPDGYYEAAFKIAIEEPCKI